MAPVEMFSQLFQRSASHGSKSTVMSPLGWALAILVSALGVSLKYSAPDYVIRGITVALGVTLSIYLLAYGYFAFTNVDALRTERYTLQKMAIEKSVRGDDLRGLGLRDPDDLDLPNTEPHRVLPSSRTEP